MKKLLLFFITGIFITGLNAQDLIIPEIVNEQLNNEQLDLTITNDDQEINISEENYYYSNTKDLGNDTIIGYIWDLSTQTWKNRTRRILTYDNADNVIEKLFQYWTLNNGWKNGLYFQFVYDNNGNRIEKTIQVWHQANEEWVNYFHRINSFNENNHLVDVVTQFWLNINQTWANKHHRIFTYVDDTLVADTSQKWKNFANTWCWQKVFLNQYGYDSTGYLRVRVTKRWRQFANIWVKKSRKIFNYNENGYLRLIIHQDWKIFAQVWKNRIRHVLSYDENGNRIERQKQAWRPSNNTWVGFARRQFTYDINNYLIETVFQHRVHNGTWKNVSFCQFAYDDEGNMIEKLKQLWDNYNSNWVNFKKWVMVINLKSSYAGINNESDSESSIKCVFANPYKINMPITFYNLEAGLYNATVFDFSGKIVCNESFSAGEVISINERVPAGMYLIVLQKDNEIFYKQKIAIMK